MTWAQLPLLRLCIPFITGILAAFFSDGKVDPGYSAILFFVAFLMMVLSVFIRTGSSMMLRFIGILPLITSFTCGFLLMLVKKTPDEFKTHLNPGTYPAQVTSEPQVKGKWLRFSAKIQSSSSGKTTSGQVMIYGDPEVQVHDGDLVLLKIPELPTAKVLNPGEFDYAGYLRKQNVLSTLFINDKSGILLVRSADGMTAAIGSWRRMLIGKIRDAPLKQETRALLMSLVLGAAEDLDAEIKSSFSASGTMHVLSVSGMHIALLYLLFIKAFSLFNVNKRLSFYLIILLVWFYAGLTGFSPSVLRAAVICTFMVVGEASSRIGSSMNLLAGSAILLLSIDPFLVFNPGFQLSYSAVAGIICFQKKLNDLFTVEGRIAKEVLNAVTVTLAAQIGTLGISLFYFGQFPVYFLFANLIIVPISSILLYVGIAYLLIMLFIEIPQFLNQGVDLLFDLFTATVTYFGQLPGAIASFSIDLFLALIVYIILIVVYCYGNRRWQAALIITCLLFLVSVRGMFGMFQKAEHSIVFYNSRSPLIVARQGKEVTRIPVDTLTHFEKPSILLSGYLLVVSGKKIFIPDSAKKMVHADVLFVTNKCRLTNSELLKSPVKIIVIASNAGWKRSRDLIKRCHELRVPVWPVREKGAFILSLDDST